MDAPELGSGASTTERVAKVLLAFNGAPAALGVTEIARSCGLGKAVVHRILQSLVTAGLVAYRGEQRRYTLGPAALALGRQAAQLNELRTAAMPLIANLAENTGETTTLSERVGHGRHYIGQVESFRSIRITIRTGESAPLWNGASGLSILAFMDDVDVEHVLRLPRTKYTQFTVTDADEIRARLALTRERGWAHSAGERVLYSSSIAAPVFDAGGEAVGSVSVAYLVDRMNDSDHDGLAQLVMTAARDASERLRHVQASGA
jgi:DNA-binding IclR family transcriptional regulator